MSFYRVVSTVLCTFVFDCDTLDKAPQICTSWPGWPGVKDLFVFGDSYTTTGFNDTTGPQPNATDPLGNPPYPGYTSSDGPNWVDYLTTTYNESLLETYNLAYGGATVDSALVLPYLPTVLSMKQQIQSEFLPTYGSHPSFAPWTSDSTLFAFFIGINDVGNSWTQKNESSLQATIFQEYAALLEQVYAAGARNFLFLNVPPVQRAPLTAVQGPAAQAAEGAAIEEWNGRMVQLTRELRSNHPDVTTFTFDTYALFNAVLNDPQMFPQTSQYKNTTGYCTAYENGTPTETYFNATCGIPVNEYFWLNTLHPTYPMQDVLAQQIASLLESVPEGGMGCNDGDGSQGYGEGGGSGNGSGMEKQKARRWAGSGSRIVKWKL